MATLWRHVRSLRVRSSIQRTSGSRPLRAAASAACVSAASARAAASAAWASASAARDSAASARAAASSRAASAAVARSRSASRSVLRSASSFVAVVVASRWPLRPARDRSHSARSTRATTASTMTTTITGATLLTDDVAPDAPRGHRHEQDLDAERRPVAATDDDGPLGGGHRLDPFDVQRPVRRDELAAVAARAAYGSSRATLSANSRSAASSSQRAEQCDQVGAPPDPSAGVTGTTAGGTSPWSSRTPSNSLRQLRPSGRTSRWRGRRRPRAGRAASACWTRSRAGRRSG